MQLDRTGDDERIAHFDERSVGQWSWLQSSCCNFCAEPAADTSRRRVPAAAAAVGSSLPLRTPVNRPLRRRLRHRRLVGDAGEARRQWGVDLDAGSGLRVRL